jgi:hypothetical protein
VAKNSLELPIMCEKDSLSARLVLVDEVGGELGNAVGELVGGDVGATRKLTERRRTVAAAVGDLLPVPEGVDVEDFARARECLSSSET